MYNADTSDQWREKSSLCIYLKRDREKKRKKKSKIGQDLYNSSIFQNQ